MIPYHAEHMSKIKLCYIQAGLIPCLGTQHNHGKMDSVDRALVLSQITQMCTV